MAGGSAGIFAGWTKAKNNSEHFRIFDHLLNLLFCEAALVVGDGNLLAFASLLDSPS
jgi:hypothetical protein